MDEDEIIEQPAETVAETTAEEPVSLADAMWGDDAEADTVLPDGGDDEDDEPKEEDEEAPETEATTEPEAPAEEAESSDDELVKGLSDKAQHRFRELVNSNKDMERRLSGFTEIISDAQVTPQDMVDLLAYGKAIRTGDFDAARRLIAAQARALEIASGKPVEMADALSDYPDLQQSVEEMELTRDHALELARVRAANEQGQRQQQQASQQQQQQTMQAEAVNTGFQEVVGMTANWRKSDIDWPTKEPLMIQRANFIQQNYPPHQWGHMVKIAYQEIGETLKAARPATQNRQPSALRPNAMGGGAKAPATAFEAMWGESEPA